MRKQKKVWIGIGAFVVAGTTAAAAAATLPQDQRPQNAARAGLHGEGGGAAPASSFMVAQHSKHGEGGERSRSGGEGEGGERSKRSSGGEGEGGERSSKSKSKSKSGGEGEGGERSKSGGEGEGGGEGGEGGSAKLEPDVSFALRIAQMRGHLLIGDQLVKEGQWAAAMPHFLHPAEELYGGIRRNLKKYDTPPFEAALKNLSNLVKRKKGGKDYDKAFQAVQDALAAADAGLKKQQKDWAGFTVETSVELVKTAASEYEAAIEKGRIGKPVEYQDARGFVLQSEKMIDSVASSLEAKDPQALKNIREALADLKQIFPSAMPPKEPVKDYGNMLGEVSRIELAASRLM